MLLTRIHCRRFRGLADLDFAPAPGLNILFGANAQGKTSVLEAILYAATARSHRTNADVDLAQDGGDDFHVLLEGAAREQPLRIEAHWYKSAKRFKVNGIAQARLSDILGRLCVVFFSPEDIDIVKGAAACRRLFLDMELSQLHPPYLRALQQYRLALRQRNELLRNAYPDPDLLAVWETQLAEHGGVLVMERQRYIEELSHIAGAIYAAVVDNEPLTLTYRPDISDPAAIASILERSRKSDLIRKTTGRGPHRDDMEIVIADRSARVFGSQGQQKSTALALKLAELELMRQRVGEYPVALLDEALAELDDERSARLLNSIPEQAQAIITTAQPDRLPEAQTRDGRRFHIERGRLEIQ